MATISYGRQQILKIFQQASSDCKIKELHDYESRIENNFGLVVKTKWPPYHTFKVKKGDHIRKAYVSLNISPRGFDVKTFQNSSQEIMPCESFSSIEV